MHAYHSCGDVSWIQLRLRAVDRWLSMFCVFTTVARVSLLFGGSRVYDANKAKTRSVAPWPDFQFITWQTKTSATARVHTDREDETEARAVAKLSPIEAVRLQSLRGNRTFAGFRFMLSGPSSCHSVCVRRMV